jgi:deoxyadenosine/deoxycytidine kinase
MPPIIISLDGNIGAGKSTLLEILRLACPDVAMVREPVDDWMKMIGDDGKNILELFYHDTPRYAYTFQHTTLMTRIANAREAIAEHAGKDTVLISERSILTDRHVFAEMLRSQGTLNKLEWDLYVRWYDLLTEHMPVAGIIYLTTSVPTCETRIKTRGRPGEVIATDYLHDLHAAHEAWVASTDVPVLSISTESDVPRDEQVEQVREFVASLRERLTRIGVNQTPLKPTRSALSAEVECSKNLAVEMMDAPIAPSGGSPASTHTQSRTQVSSTPNSPLS